MLCYVEYFMLCIFCCCCTFDLTVPFVMMQSFSLSDCFAHVFCKMKTGIVLNSGLSVCLWGRCVVFMCSLVKT